MRGDAWKIVAVIGDLIRPVSPRERSIPGAPPSARPKKEQTDPYKLGASSILHRLQPGSFGE